MVWPLWRAVCPRLEVCVLQQPGKKCISSRLFCKKFSDKNNSSAVGTGQEASGNVSKESSTSSSSSESSDDDAEKKLPFHAESRTADAKREHERYSQRSTAHDHSARKVEHSSDRAADPEAKKELAKGKLLSLLSEMTVIQSTGVSPGSSRLQLTKPKQRLGLEKKHEATNMKGKDECDEKLESDLLSAVKDVASASGKDAEKIEAELMEGLEAMSLKEPEAGTSKSKAESKKGDTPERPKETSPVVDEEVGENLMSAVKAVASSVSGDAEVPQSELSKKLLSLVQRKSVGSQPEMDNMVDLIGKMKVERGESRPSERYGRRQSSSSIEKLVHPQRFPSDKLQTIHKIDIFNSPALGVFNLDESEKVAEGTELLMWKKLLEKKMKMLVQFAPSNAFEEMIQWTEQGKHWKFPIDNETDVGAEQNVGFHEHVFLERHLHGFPKKGPVRHFMELVITGLSKNPYITVERKVENIEWFRQYFKEKEHILKEHGAVSDS